MESWYGIYFPSHLCTLMGIFYRFPPPIMNTLSSRPGRRRVVSACGLQRLLHTLRRFAWIKETLSFLSYLFVSSRTPVWLGCATVELSNGDDWYVYVLYAFECSNMPDRNILNCRIIVAQISSIIFNTSTTHFSTFPWDINRPTLPTIYIAVRTTSFPNPLR